MDITQNYSFFPTIRRVSSPIPTYFHTRQTLSTHAFFLYLSQAELLHGLSAEVLPYFLSNQRYFTLFSRFLFSAEGFSGNYYPFFSQILYYSPPPTPRLIRGLPLSHQDFFNTNHMILYVSTQISGFFCGDNTKNNTFLFNTMFKSCIAPTLLILYKTKLLFHYPPYLHGRSTADGFAILFF